MIYKADQIGLWLRLNTAALNVDKTLANAFQDLMVQGAELTLNTMTGALKFGAGAMNPDEYKRIVESVLSPRREKIMTLQHKIAASQHPWLQSIQRAHDDLAKRVERGQQALRDAATAGDNAKFARTAPVVTERLWQANSLARALTDAGYARYWDACSSYIDALERLRQTCERGGLPVSTAGVTWPVETPDGWIWVSDMPDVAPAEVDLGKDRGGKKAPLPDEPVITDHELGNALATVELMLARKAG